VTNASPGLNRAALVDEVLPNSAASEPPSSRSSFFEPSLDLADPFYRAPGSSRDVYRQDRRNLGEQLHLSAPEMRAIDRTDWEGAAFMTNPNRGGRTARPRRLFVGVRNETLD
jgi:hypothetical protein